MREHFGRAAKEEFQQMVNNIDQYIVHVKSQVITQKCFKKFYNCLTFQMESEVTSCQPLTQIARQTTAAVCAYTIDPYVKMTQKLGNCFQFIISERDMDVYADLPSSVDTNCDNFKLINRFIL